MTTNYTSSIQLLLSNNNISTIVLNKLTATVNNEGNRNSIRDAMQLEQFILALNNNPKENTSNELDSRLKNSNSILKNTSSVGNNNLSLKPCSNDCIGGFDNHSTRDFSTAFNRF